MNRKDLIGIMTLATETLARNSADQEKPNVEQVEAAGYEDDADLKAKNNAKLDYSGFAQKTDPKEIKLVRKLACASW